MTPTRRRSLSTAGLLGILLLASCAAPISYRVVPCKTPGGDFTVHPLSEALHEMEAGKAARDSNNAAGHFLECARLAGTKALLGEPGALALYNHAVGRLVDTLQSARSLPWDGPLALPTGSTTCTLRGTLERGAPAVRREYHIVDELSFSGDYAEIQANRPGVGAPLVAVSPETKDYRSRFETPQVYTGLTAVVRFPDAKSATLELHDPLDEDTIPVAGRNPALAADFSAPTDLAMAIMRPDKLGLVRMLDPQKYSDTARLVRMQKYDPNRIPVLFVHGLQDTPATWAPMYASLLKDPEIRKHYQFWAFSYPSGYPYPYSASLLRKELDGVKRAFPDHKDIILVGHSMGSLISRLMVTDAGDRLWKSLLGNSPSASKIQGASRQLLEDSLVFHNRPEFKEVIFISAPHRGSELASIWLGRLFSRLVHIPAFLTDARNAVSSVVTADNASLQLDRAPNSIDTLAPNNRFVLAVNKLPIAPGVTYHSIMGDRGKGDTPNSSDGVVPYWSSHMDGAASEKIVPSGHGAHQNPEGIEEVHRILKLALRKSR